MREEREVHISSVLAGGEEGLNNRPTTLNVKPSLKFLLTCCMIQVTYIYYNGIAYALQRRNTEISKQIFPEKEYRGLSPNFHINASVSDIYIPTIGLPILLEEICRPIPGLYKSLTDT